MFGDSDDEFFDANETFRQNTLLSGKRRRQDTASSPIPEVFLENTISQSGDEQRKSLQEAASSQGSLGCHDPRHSRLSALRDKMRIEFSEGTVVPPDGHKRHASAADVLTTDCYGDVQSLGSAVDKMSLASWGKHLLLGTKENVPSSSFQGGSGDLRRQDSFEDQNAKPKQQTLAVIHPLDSLSTKGDDAELLIAPTSTRKLSPQPQSINGTTGVTGETLPFTKQRTGSSVSEDTLSNEKQRASTIESTKSSSGSSKGSTLEHSSQSVHSASSPRSQGGRHGGSLELISSSNLRRSLASVGRASSKSNSLPRELSVDYILNNEEAIRNQRKHSEAVEIVDSITSDLVKKDTDSPAYSGGTTLDLTPVALSRLPELPEDRESVSPDRENPPNLPFVKNGHKQPDLVISATNLKPDEKQPSLERYLSHPTAPPRKKKLLTQSSYDEQACPSSSRHSSDYVAKNSLSIDDLQRDVLSNVPVKNLDTGEIFSLPEADQRIPPGMNPLSEHIMKRTNTLRHGGRGGLSDSDETSVCSFESSRTSMSARDYLNSAKRKTMRYKDLIGGKLHKTVSKLRASHQFGQDKEESSSDEEDPDGCRIIRVRASKHNKGPYEFDQVKMVQSLKGHTGSVWCVRISLCGRLLATAGQDNLIRIWVLKDCFDFFNDMKSKYCGSNSLDNMDAVELKNDVDNFSQSSISDRASQSSVTSDEDDIYAPFMPHPFCVYQGHTADVLDVAWSKNYFLLSSSMDKTVRLWHVSRRECLCCFQHMDFVTAIAFLPKDDRYFLSGSLDGKLRLWNIPEKKVAIWNELDSVGNNLITALCFVKNGKYAVVGTFDGRCIFFTTDQLKYFTMLNVTKGRGKTARSHKITGMEVYGDKLLITSNDSRIRLYNVEGLSLVCKFKGFINSSSQIKASFSHNGRFIIAGSENKNIYLWKTTLEALSLRHMRRDKNALWECIRAHNAVVTTAIFAPKPEAIFAQISAARLRFVHRIGKRNSQPSESAITRRRTDDPLGPFMKNDPRTGLPRKPGLLSGEVIVSGDFSGEVFVFLNKPKVKTGTSTFLASF